MNDVLGITKSVGQQTSKASGSLGELGAQKDQFLKMLLAQLKNQDPLNAPDADKFNEQMTQFGQLEQLFNLNASMEKLSSSQGTGDRFQAVSLIGKKVEAESNSIQVKAGTAEDVGYYVPQSGAEVKVEVLNASGAVVRTMIFNEDRAGLAFHEFDGKNNSGAQLADGLYSTRVTAKSPSGIAVASTPIIRAAVTGVRFTSEGPLIEMGDRIMSMDQVTAVQQA